MFAASAADRAQEQGKQGVWLLTHNTYTEISSESGIPGFLLFAGSLVSTWLLLRAVHERAKRDPRFVTIRNTAFCMMLSMLGFSISIFFASMSYRYYFPSLVGLTIAFSVAAQAEMNRSSTARPSRPSQLPWAPRTTQ
jgi:O-antigen ligase